jgi:4-amino-4-deoxy-L-arabinose transferase-like glycosyltransferase
MALALVLWLPGFFVLPPGDRDESRFAQASLQMNQSGDYVRIMNGAVPRNRKPIGIYWLQAPAALLAGPNLSNPIWPYRIPSLLGGLAAVLATYAAARRLGGNALLAGAMLAGSLILTTETHIAKTDAALLGVTTIAMAILSRAWLAAPVPRWQAASFWLAMGAGILIKGPITPMVAGLAAITLCVWERRARWLCVLRPVWGVPLMLAVVLPWFVAIGIATHGAFFAQAVGGDLAAKLSGGSETHGGFPGLHLLLLPLLAFPATFAVLAALPTAWARRHEAATRFLVAWGVPSWLVFEAVPTKLPHYTLPLYPALFLLAARVDPTKASRWARRVGLAALILAGVVIGAAALALPIVLRQPWWIGLPAVAAAFLVVWLAARNRLALGLAACVPLYGAILQVELPALTPLWIAPRVEQALRQDWPAWNSLGDGLAVAGYAEPSLMFLTGSHTQILANGAQAAAALRDGSASLVIVTDREMPAFTRAAGTGPHTLAEITGFNYSRGRWVTLTLLTH